MIHLNCIPALQVGLIRIRCYMLRELNLPIDFFFQIHMGVKSLAGKKGG